MPLSVNTLVLSGKLMSDPEQRTFQSGGCVVQFQIGFLEGSWFDSKEKKWKYKNGFITVKKMFNDKGKPDYLMELAKGMNVLVTGKLGFEQWESQGSKKSKNVIVADKVQGITVDGSKPARENNRSSYQNNRDDEQGDEDDSPGGDEIPF